MTRLPALTYDQADPQQRALWDHIVSTRGDALDLVTEQGGLAGPFAAFVQRPTLGENLIGVGGAVRFGSSLEPRLRELAITAVGARWKSEFEFWAHSQIALAEGISPAIIDALAAGEKPAFDDTAERVVYDYALALATDGRVDQTTYDAALASVGVDGIVDLTHAVGYYSHISFILNAFEVPLPDGVAKVFS